MAGCWQSVSYSISSNHENKCWWSCMSWECRDAEDWVRPDRNISCSQVYLWSYLSGQEKNNTYTSGLGPKQLTNNKSAIYNWCLWLGSPWENEDIDCTDCLLRKYYFFSYNLLNNGLYFMNMIWSGNASPFPSPFVREAWLQGRNLKQPNTQGFKGNSFFFFFRQTIEGKKHDKEETDIIIEAEQWAQLDTEGGKPGRRVWMIFGFGDVFGSSSSSMSLSHTCTTTLGVDSVPAWSSYFSPEKQEK